MSCWLWTLRKSKGQRTIGNAFFVPSARCISGFNPFWAKMFYHIFLTKKIFGKRRKRRERRGGDNRKTKQEEREKEKNRFISIFKSNLSKSTSLQISNISMAEPRHLHDTKFQIRAVLLIFVWCTHIFMTKMQNVCLA